MVRRVDAPLRWSSRTARSNGRRAVVASWTCRSSRPDSPRRGEEDERRRLAELFPIWEVRNGARAPELNHPAATYVATRDGIGIGGSDDHAGVDIGRTFTEAPPASTPHEFLTHMRAGSVLARGAQGSDAAREACTPDAMRLCNEFIPDEARVRSCMLSKRSQLSEACRVAMRPRAAEGERGEGRYHQHHRHRRD